MSAIVPFQFEGENVRIIDREGEPWFVLADICRICEVGNPSQAASRLDPEERDTIVLNEGHIDQGLSSNSLGTSLGIVSESGLYSLILSSRKEAARRFKKWITSEVLPAIRKTGTFGSPNLDDPAVLQTLLLGHVAKRIEAENRAAVAEKAVEVAKPKVGFYDRFAEHEGLYGLQNAARVLGQNPNKFIGWLKEWALFYQGGALVPKVYWREKGVFEVKCTVVDDKARYQSFVTPKGLQYLAVKLGVDQLPLGGAA